MSQETIEIIIKEDGSATTAARMRALGDTAAVTGTQVKGLEASTVSAGRNMSQAAQAAGQVESGVARAGAAAREGASAMGTFGASTLQARDGANKLMEIMVALGAAVTLKEMLTGIDNTVKMKNALQQVTTSVENFKEVEKALEQVSKETFSSMAGNVEMFRSLSLGAKDLHLSQSQLLDITRVLAMGMNLEGKSAEESERSIRMLSMSFATGQVSARTFHAMLMQMPALMHLLAESFGLGGNRVGMFMKLVEGGRIPVKELATHLAGLTGQGAALEGETARVTSGMGRFSGGVIQATGAVTALDRAHAAIQPTMSMAWRVLTNASEQYFNELNRGTGILSVITNAMMMLAENMHTLAPILIAVSVGIGALVLGLGLAALAAAAIAAPITLIVAGLIALVTWLATAGTQMSFFGSSSITVWGAVAGTVRTVYQLFRDYFSWIGSVAMNVWHVMVATFNTIAGPGTLVRSVLTLMWDGFTRLIDVIGYLLKGFASLISMIPGVGAALSAVTDMIGALGDKLTGYKDKWIANMEESSRSMDAFQKKTESDSIKIANQDIPRVVNAFDTMNSGVTNNTRGASSAVGSMANQVQNYMGQMVSATDDWAARSGADFMKVSQAASASAASVAQSAASMRSSMNSIHGPGLNTTIQAPGGPGAAMRSESGDWFDNSSGGSWGISDLSQWYGSTGGSSGISDLGWATGGSFIVPGMGGTDSQAISFMATPGERVSVETPGQQGRNDGDGGGRGGAPVQIYMNVSTPDAGSFQRSQRQIVSSLASQLMRVGIRGG